MSRQTGKGRKCWCDLVSSLSLSSIVHPFLSQFLSCFFILCLIRMFESPGKQLKKCWNDPLISHSFSFVMSPFLCQFPSHSLISYLLWLFKSPMKVLVIYANLAILHPSASSFLHHSLSSLSYLIFSQSFAVTAEKLV